MKNIKLEILHEISIITNSTIVLDERLKLITEITTKQMNTDSSHICLLDEDKKTLTLKASTGLNQEKLYHVKLKMGEGITGWVAEKKEPVILANAPSDPRFIYFPETGEKQFKSLLSVPILEDNECIGVITTQRKDKKKYSPSELELMETISNQISGIIRNAQLYQKATVRASRLAMLHGIGQALSSTLTLSDLFHLIVKNSCEISKASASVLWLREKNKLQLKAYYCLKENLEFKTTLPIRSAVINHWMKNKDHLILNKKDAMASKLIFSSINSAVFIPLTYRSRIRGILCVIDQKKGNDYTSFSRNDAYMLSTMANYAIIAIDNAYAYERLEKLDAENKNKIRELSTLHEFSVAMQSTIRLDKILRIILGCVTSGKGFGFNRAMLLLVNENTGTLQGMMGLDSASEEEEKKAPKKSQIKNQTTLESILSKDVAMLTKSKYNKFAKSIRISLDNKMCIFSKAVNERRTFNIVDAEGNPKVNKNFLKQLGTNNFSIVPIIAKDKVLGVILVDKYYDRKPIIDKDLQFLNRFAVHARWAIENAGLFTKLMQTNRDIIDMQDRLIQSEHLATLGKFSAEIAHEIKNPLVSIGGFARRLYKSTKKNSLEKKYSEIIVKEVGRLEKLLKDILNYSVVKKPSSKKHNLNDLINDALELYKKEIAKNKITLTTKLSPNIIGTSIDRNQISQVLINFIVNSMESMPGGGDLIIETKKSKKFENGTKFTIRDTGGGVPAESLHNIFNPFFTTKESGTGLGLPLIRKIINAHGGILDLKNNPGKGIEFTIHFPANG